jgi:hypothetical protein
VTDSEKILAYFIGEIQERFSAAVSKFIHEERRSVSFLATLQRRISSLNSVNRELSTWTDH